MHAIGRVRQCNWTTTAVETLLGVGPRLAPLDITKPPAAVQFSIMPNNLQDSWSFATQIDIPAPLVCDLCRQETMDNWPCSDGRKDGGGFLWLRQDKPPLSATQVAPNSGRATHALGCRQIRSKRI
jgi:hypothetical protein